MTKPLRLAEKILLTLIDEFVNNDVEFRLFYGRFREVYVDEAPPAILSNRYALFAEVNSNGDELEDGDLEGGIDSQIEVASFRRWLSAQRANYPGESFYKPR